MVLSDVERLARNETFFREVNERIDAVAGQMGGEEHRYEYVCECSDPTCTERVVLTRSEYEDVRATPVRFVLAPGHATAAIENVVEREVDHHVVEKIGPAARIAVALDPRAA